MFRMCVKGSIERGIGTVKREGDMDERLNNYDWANAFRAAGYRKRFGG